MLKRKKNKSNKGKSTASPKVQNVSSNVKSTTSVAVMDVENKNVTDIQDVKNDTNNSMEVNQVGDTATNNVTEVCSTDINSNTDAVIKMGVLIKAPSDTDRIHYAIPATVIRIAEGAFENNSNLVSVAIPPSVTDIGRRAFANCTALRVITIPDTIRYLYADTFSGCKALKELNLPSNITLLQ